MVELSADLKVVWMVERWVDLMVSYLVEPKVE